MILGRSSWVTGLWAARPACSNLRRVAMPYVNVGALVDGVRPKTKKALKDAVQSNLDKVRFDKTSAHDGLGVIDPDELTQGVTLVVTGPDPYTSRKWYANVVRVNGSVRVT